MKKLLDEFVKVLQYAKSPVVNHLNKGINTERIDSIVKEFDVSLPVEAADLFKWRNGTNIEGLQKLQLETWIFPLASFISLETCMSVYKQCMDMRYQWKENLFVIFDSGIGDLFMIDVNENSATKGMIFMDSPAAVDFLGPVTVFDSLAACIETQIECYKKGAYVIEEGTLVVINHDKKVEISKQNNSKSEYWKEL
ncbi:SMI1/KNR4 family protein [Foetidibacter luteolus]|uniref:SMI1/KNR4 family protein n=1 Tax=Foetidibacter luteolus TaxID=2608880 RepID=UPI00129B495E|nr:SMI1/KNR4 family protein [Foetidibacter luteolus]